MVQGNGRVRVQAIKEAVNSLGLGEEGRRRERKGGRSSSAACCRLGGFGLLDTGGGHG